MLFRKSWLDFVSFGKSKYCTIIFKYCDICTFSRFFPPQIFLSTTNSIENNEKMKKLNKETDTEKKRKSKSRLLLENCCFHFCQKLSRIPKKRELEIGSGPIKIFLVPFRSASHQSHLRKSGDLSTFLFSKNRVRNQFLPIFIFVWCF